MRHLIALLIVALTSSVAAQHKEERAGITNFTRVDAVIACGGATETSALPALKQEGFTSVINLRVANEPGASIDENKAEAEKIGLRYFHLPLQTAAPDPMVVDRFLATVSDKTNQPVYIHCGSANRVAAVWMIKRVLQDEWTMDKALTEARAIGLTSAPLEKFAVEYIASHKN